MAEDSIDYLSPLLAEEVHLEMTNVDEVGRYPTILQEHTAGYPYIRHECVWLP